MILIYSNTCQLQSRHLNNCTDATLLRTYDYRRRSIKAIDRVCVCVSQNTVTINSFKGQLIYVIFFIWLPQQCNWNLRSSGILRSVDWYLFTNVSGQPIGPIFKGQVSHKISSWTDYLTLEDGTDKWPVTSVNNYQSTLQVTSQKSGDLSKIYQSNSCLKTPRFDHKYHVTGWAKYRLLILRIIQNLYA
jgi:hypothetical protein